jgi:hypothetical protein
MRPYRTALKKRMIRERARATNEITIVTAKNLLRPIRNETLSWSVLPVVCHQFPKPIIRPNDIAPVTAPNHHQ